jgi:gas vesicle protein
MADMQPSNDNSALIGGIVGGVLALLAVVLAAFVLSRKRRSSSPQPTDDDTRAPTLIYDKIDAISWASGYDEAFLMKTNNNYDHGNVSVD